MKLFEHEAKEILAKYGILIPKGRTASIPDEAVKIAKEIGRQVVLKAQILVSGRGKAGGIKFAEDADEAGEIASQLLGTSIKDCRVDYLLVEESLDMSGQFYASVTIDRQAKTYVILASDHGGVDIEEVSRSLPGSIARYWVDILAGFEKADAAAMLKSLELNPDHSEKFAGILSTLYQVTLGYDAELVETNPLALTPDGQFVAVDARIIIDDNAIPRHEVFQERSLLRADDTPTEAEARKQHLAYVDLDGDIGIVGNGAGLVMSTIDLVSYMGGSPGNFLDIGGGSSVATAKTGIMLVMSKPEIKVVLINILGGITRCDVVAKAVVEALDESGSEKPIVIRLRGTNQEEGIQILENAGINSYSNMEKAVAEVVKKSGVSIEKSLN